MTRTLTTINEEYIGTYQAPVLELRIGGAFARLNPKGTLVIGASGRVDMEGPGGKVMLILDSEEGTEKRFEDRRFIWKIVNRIPKVTAIKLDLDTFSDALIQIISM